MVQIPFLREEFDWLKLDFRELDPQVWNEYEVIYIYLTSGANESFFIGYCDFTLIPKQLRDMGVIKPKILVQLDHYGQDPNKFIYGNMVQYVNGFIDMHLRKHWNLSVPVFYAAFPIDVLPVKWREFEEKANTVGLNRFYGSPYPSMRFAEKIHTEFHCLGINRGNRYGEEYFNYLAEHKLGLDFHTSGITWSRFGAECAYAGTPVLGEPTYTSLLIANDQLTGNPEDENLIYRAKMLLENKEYYEATRQGAYKNIVRHLNPEVCSERYKCMFRQLGIDVY